MRDFLPASSRDKSGTGPMYRQGFLVVALAWFITGCGLLGGLRAEHTATSAQKPSNVAVYLSVSNDGHAVRDLKASDFKIYEDDQLVAPEQTRQTLLDRDIAAAHHTLLLVDMSGAITEGTYRYDVAKAAGAFVDRVRKTQPVTVYAFDGGRTIRLVAEYPKGQEPVAQVEGLTTYTSEDTSSNLFAAVIEAIEKLDARLMVTPRPIRIGTLVLFAQGPDLAGRATEDQMLDAIDDSKHHVLAIGIEGSELHPEWIAKNGSFTATSKTLLKKAFVEAAGAAADAYEQYYLLAYCSPARAGTRELTVEVITADAEGKAISDRMRTEFDATGFQSGCDPNATPRFVQVAKTKAPPPGETGDGTTVEPNEPAAEEDAEGSPAAEPPLPSAAPPGPAPDSSPAPSDEEDEIVPPPNKPGYAQ